MRRGWEAVGLMAFINILLAITVNSVKAGMWGPSWVSPVLYVCAAFACLTVLVWPDFSVTRAGSGAVVSAAFAWRAVSAAVFNTFGPGGRPWYAVVLYIGFAVYVSLTWHRVLPAPAAVRSRLRGLAGDG